jgi:hypothetical protein
MAGGLGSEGEDGLLAAVVGPVEPRRALQLSPGA